MSSLGLNAWTGFGQVTGVVADAAAWASNRKIESAPRLLAPDEIDYLNWEDARVGWGVILAEGAVVPPGLQQLIDQRKAKIFHYRPRWKYRFVLLRNRSAGKDISINGAPYGITPDALPYYLLIYGSPDEVPWRLQYILQANRCVGRLALTGTALENYITALRTGDWTKGDKQNQSKQNRVVIWSVARDSITDLMRNSIAARLAKLLKGDRQIGDSAKFLDGAQQPAAIEELAATLTAHQPGLVVTTSHGMTGPLNVPEAMQRNLGAPVDASGQVLNPIALMQNWQPAGAIWYCHACCSAGADSQSNFEGLFDTDSAADKVLKAIAGLGACISPLATALLGAERPVRAFIGHVEPTFDWTLQEPATGQFLTAGIEKALYRELYVEKGKTERPIGYAFREWYGRTNVLCKQYDEAKKAFNNGEPTKELLLALQLAARDVESTVILGDPTVAMPGLE